MSRFKKTIILAALFVLSCQLNAFAASSASVSIVVSASEHINDLKWSDELNSIHTSVSDAGKQSSVTLLGTYPREGWKLYYGEKEIPRNKGGGFRIEIPLNSDDLTFTFNAIGPNGEKESEKIDIDSRGWAITNQVPKIQQDKKLFLFPSLGISSIKSTQTGKSDYSTLVMTAKFSMNYRIVPKKWDLGLSAYSTALHLTKSSDVKAYFMGFNARLGYLFPIFSTDWFLSLYGGYYYTTTFVTADAFGYKNLGGPQIYPAIRKVFDHGAVASGYFKFSPVASSLSLLKLSNREIAAGLGYSWILPEQQSIGINVDYSNVAFNLANPDDSSNVSISVNSISLGVQYGF